jgi:hypothetical protein
MDRHVVARDYLVEAGFEESVHPGLQFAHLGVTCDTTLDALLQRSDHA